jgi:hypothetical protein
MLQFPLSECSPKTEFKVLLDDRAEHPAVFLRSAFVSVVRQLIHQLVTHWPNTILCHLLPDDAQVLIKVAQCRRGVGKNLLIVELIGGLINYPIEFAGELSLQ